MGGKSKSSGQLSESWRLARILLRPQHRGPVLVLIAIAVALGGFSVAWNRWGRQALSTGEYLVTPNEIVVTPQPKWIHADVKTEVVRTANLGERMLNEPKLVEEVAVAFALHPWVARVVRVEKRFSAGVQVSLEYRRPVAAVEIASRGEAGLLFVDADGVLLPSSDFAAGQAKDFLRITAGNETPAGGYGAPWGSDRVAGAARIAAALGDRWRGLGLYRVAAVESSAGELTFELRTKGDVRVVWGAVPGREASGEPSAEQKISSLEQLVADKGPLDRNGGPTLVELQVKR
jgi:hypothetical protein